MDWAILAQMMIALASLVLAGAVFYYTKKTIALESLRSVRDSWMQLDQMALSESENLFQADRLFFGENNTEQDARRRWIIMMALNPVVSDYMAAKVGLLPDSKAGIDGCRAILKQLLQHADVYKITQSGAYAVGGFDKFCDDVRTEVASKKV